MLIEFKQINNIIKHFALVLYSKMTCYLRKYSGELKANSEIEEIKWLNYSDKNKVSEVDKIIFDSLRNDYFLD